MRSSEVLENGAVVGGFGCSHILLRNSVHSSGVVRSRQRTLSCAPRQSALAPVFPARTVMKGVVRPVQRVIVAPPQRQDGVRKHSPLFALAADHPIYSTASCELMLDRLLVKVVALFLQFCPRHYLSPFSSSYIPEMSSSASLLDYESFYTDQENNDLAFVRYRPESLKQLCEETAFSKREIQMIYRGFKQGCPTGIVEFEQFREIYSQFFPRGDSSRYAQFVFNTFDRDKNGHLSFDEFVLGLSVISRGSTDDKLRWVFTLYDTDQDGYLSKKDLSNIVTAVYALIDPRLVVDTRTVDEHVFFMFSRLDKTTDDRISLAEFLDACAKDEAICASMCLFDTKI
uniref:EF-hand domain-containing protein n=1 Tax=Plectus sambesii TaxID=2011161 RepID=A0A914VXV1_9BILA